MDEHPPILYYLETNHSPSDDEASTLKEFITDRKAAIVTLDQKMEEMKATLASMERKRNRHLTDIERASSILAPIRRLSVDVLTSIFLHCLERDEFGDKPAAQGNHPSTAISHVSQYWRSLALTTPLLWSQMDIKIPIMGLQVANITELEDANVPMLQKWIQRIDKVQHIVEAWTRRSATCPLRLGITDENTHINSFPEPDLEQARERFTNFVKLIQASSRRWGALNVNLTFNSITSESLPLFNLPQTEYRTLLRLGISLRDNPQLPSDVVTSYVSSLASSSILTAHSLNSIIIDGLWANGAASILNPEIPTYQSVTNLTLDMRLVTSHSFRQRHAHGGTGVETLEFLRSFPHLTKCCLHLWGDNRIPTTFTPISLSHLKTMTILGPQIRKGLAPCLRLPRLEILRLWALQSGNRYLRENESGVLEFITLYGKQLSDLFLFPDSITPSSFLVCLKSIPDVRILTFSGTLPFSATTQTMDVAILKALGAVNVCPKLETITMRCVRNHAHEGVVEKAFVDFLVSRCSAGLDVSAAGERKKGASKIHTVFVRFSDSPKIDIWKELRERNIDLGGVKLTVQYPPPKS